MFIRSAFEWVDALPSSIALRESLNAYPTLLTTHVVSMCLFAGLIAFWDMRLVGMTLKKVPVSNIPTRIFPWALTGYGINLVTGGLLLYSQPMRYYDNFYFWAKMALMAVAGINMLWFHYATYKSVQAWDQGREIPLNARLAGVVSLVLWAGVVVTGRMMAYAGLMPGWWNNLNIGA